MKVGILGAGAVGVPVARALASAGHAVSLANSRGPETIRDLADSLGVTAASATDAVSDAEVVIISVNPGSYARVAETLAGLAGDVPVIDTGNYHPLRDGQVATMDDGQVEAHWISEQLGRPVTKAWNAVLAQTLVDGGLPAGAAGRIALPISGDDAHGRKIASTLTDITGFDPLDIGGLEESWRIQPGTSAYCTELPLEDLRAAVEQADRANAPIRRDLCTRAFWTFGDDITRETVVRLHRAITLTADPA